MIKLDREEAYVNTFTTTIENCIEIDGEWHVTLTESYFYPEKGGQPCDIGIIEELAVTRVFEKEGTLYHVMPKAPVKRKNVKCKIDWARRYDHMQHHSAQHLFSACLEEMYQATTVSFHLGSETCTIDTNKSVSNDQLTAVEKQVNAYIHQNVPITILYPTKQELKKMKLKKEMTKEFQQVRIVEMEEIDQNPCGGTHVKSTIELQLFKIVKCEKHKTGVRITFLCGNRAVQYVQDKVTKFERLCQMLTCNDEGVLQKIENTTAQLKQQQAENGVLQNQLADYESKEMVESSLKIGNVSVIKMIHENKNVKALMVSANKLTQTPNVIVLFAAVQADSVSLLFAASEGLKKVDMNSLLKDAITLLDGKGGGKATMAQGAGKNNGNVTATLDYALSVISKQL
ncbi:MAG: alanyl-tRNA editing protein [Bacilli bacterium]